MAKLSAGLLMYRWRSGDLEVLLVHPGGPFWAKKEIGAWSLPKGEYEDGSDPLEAARREFEEELGFAAKGQLTPLKSIKQPSGKIVTAWAVQGNFDPSKLKSNTFTVEWPKNSGVAREYPEIDRAEWFSLNAARLKILPGQLGFLDRLAELISAHR